MPAQPQDSPGEPPPAPPPSAAAPTAHPSLREQIAAALTSLRRIADLQVRIWLARVKNAALRIVLFIVLSVVSLLLAIAALVWLYAGTYRVLTDVLHIPTAWALLIFGGLHLLVAGILMVAAISILKGPKAKKTATGVAP